MSLWRVVRTLAETTFRSVVRLAKCEYVRFPAVTGLTSFTVHSCSPIASHYVAMMEPTVWKSGWYRPQRSQWYVAFRREDIDDGSSQIISS